jgi:hypothetical protein
MTEVHENLLSKPMQGLGRSSEKKMFQGGQKVCLAPDSNWVMAIVTQSLKAFEPVSDQVFQDYG